MSAFIIGLSIYQWLSEVVKAVCYMFRQIKRNLKNGLHLHVAYNLVGVTRYPCVKRQLMVSSP